MKKSNMIFRISDISNTIDSVEMDIPNQTTTNDFISRFEETIGIPFNRVDIFNNERRITESRNIMDEYLFELPNLTIIISDKPIRIMDTDIHNLVDSMEGLPWIEYFSIWGLFGDELEQTFGNVENWDTSFITNMEWWFSYYPNKIFNKDISKWNVSGVKNMSSLFSLNEEFNYNLNQWDVSNVTTMEDMFLGAIKFDQDLSNWNTTNVRNMRNMFGDGCKINRQQIEKYWDLSNVDTREMFT